MSSAALRLPSDPAEFEPALPGTGAVRALVDLGRAVRECGYRFTTVTPATHSRVNGRAGNAEARDLRDVFGWSRRFRPALLPRPMLTLLESAGMLEHDAGRLCSGLRFATLAGAKASSDPEPRGGEMLLAHSAFPTVSADSVFFGPDSYRFVALIRRVLANAPLVPVRSLVDIGCGSGVGGLAAALALPRAPQRLVLADINPRALLFARANAALAGMEAAECVASDVLAGVDGQFDLIISNPPYLADPARRVYRDGGGAYGEHLSLRIVREAVSRLAPGGRLILYTGTAIVEGEDQFRRGLLSLLQAGDLQHEYLEIDPDVFGEELEMPDYAKVERIAAVGLVVRKSGGSRP